MGPRLGGRGDQRRVRAAARAAADARPRAARRAARRPPRRRPFGARRRGGAQPAGPGPLVADRRRCSRAAPDPAARRRTQAELLLERYGIVTREQVLAEGIPGGFSALYDSLAALETLGVCRRGYFVEGLGGAQFALPGAVERLRAQRDDDEAPPLVLAATDPAQPYGAALPWPKRDDESARARRASPAPTSCSPAPSRCSTSSAAARACRRSSTPTTRACAPALAALADVVTARPRSSELALERVDGEPVVELAARRRLLVGARLPRGPAAADAERLSGAEVARCPRATRSIRGQPDPAGAGGARARRDRARRSARHARDRWPERLAGRAVDRGRGARQAPVPALRGRARRCTRTCG